MNVLERAYLWYIPRPGPGELHTYIVCPTRDFLEYNRPILLTKNDIYIIMYDERSR